MTKPNFRVTHTPKEPVFPNADAADYEVGTIVQINDDPAASFIVADNQRDGHFWSRLRPVT